MRVHVEYDVPASALVNLDSGEVERVVVWCEGIHQRDGEYGVVTAGSEMPVEEPTRERAQEIVDSITWPAWDIG